MEAVIEDAADEAYASAVDEGIGPRVYANLHRLLIEHYGLDRADADLAKKAGLSASSVIRWKEGSAPRLGNFIQVLTEAALPIEAVVRGAFAPYDRMRERVTFPDMLTGSTSIAEREIRSSPSTAEDSLVPKTQAQLELLKLADAIKPEDADAAYNALSGVIGRRGLHQGHASETGST